MKKIKIFLILILLITSTGCYNYKELNDLAITTAIGIDKTDTGYLVTAQVVNTSKDSSQGSNSSTPSIIIYSAEDKTIQAALRKIVLTSPNKLYLYHMQIFIISEEVAKDGIQDILDISFRSSESRKQYNLLIAKDVTSKDILSTLTPIDTLVSSNIKKNLLSDSNYLGVSELITIEDVINNYLNDNIELSIPSITIKGSTKDKDTVKNLETTDPEAKIALSEMSIFKKDKLIGYLNEENSIGLSFLKNKIDNTIITYECEENKYLVSKIIESTTSINITKNKLEIAINITGNGNISEVHCDLNLESEKVIKKIETKINHKIEKIINNTISDIINNYNTDIFGFLNLYYQNNYNYYKKIKKDWYQNNLKNIKFNIKSDIKLTEKGNSLRVIKNEQ